MTSPSYINAYTLTSAAGTGLQELRACVSDGGSGLDNSGWPNSDVDTYLGKVDEAAIAATDIESRWRSRNNTLALLALRQDGFEDIARAAIDQHGAHRTGIVLGTSTSSIGRTEAAYRALDEDNNFTPEYCQESVHSPHSTGLFLAHYLGVSGPSITISTACSSSAKAFATAARWLEADIVDAVIVGGVDSLCLSVIYGFHSLQLVSTEPCRPFDQNRNGISLGEAGGFALLTRQPDGASVSLLGFGESTDAWHMSSPHPEGLGARLSMQQALDTAGLTSVDYLNLHGTGTRANDDIEGLACTGLLNKPEQSAPLLMSATKGITGHTLGAAGIAEAILAMDSIVTGVIPGTINSSMPEERVSESLLLKPTQQTVRTAMTNSFGFGGNNCTLIFGATN